MADVSGKFVWKTYKDENTNAKKQSAEIRELPPAKFDWERSSDLERDQSWEKLNIEVSKLLNEDSNLNSTNVSQKRYRWRPSHPFTSNAKRTKTQTRSGSSIFVGATNVKKRWRMSPKNRKSGKDMVKAECFNFRPLLIAGSHGGETVWTRRLNEHRGKKDEWPPTLTGVCANWSKFPRLPETIGNNMKVKTGQKPGAMEWSRLAERNGKLEPEKGKNVAVPPKTTNRSGNWISEENFEPSLDFLVWSKEELSSENEFIDDTKKNHQTNLEVEKMSVSPSLSPEPTTEFLMQPHDAMDMAPNSSPCSRPFVSTVGTSEKAKPARSSNARKPFMNSRGALVSLTMHQIEKRFRQLMIGKQTTGYINYVRTISKEKRCSWHPKTPDVQERISKRRHVYQQGNSQSGADVPPTQSEDMSCTRRFNGKVNVWRRKLHFWDVPISFTSLPDRRQGKVLPRAIGLKTKCSANWPRDMRWDNKGRSRTINPPAKPLIKASKKKSFEGVNKSKFFWEKMRRTHQKKTRIINHNKRVGLV